MLDWGDTKQVLQRRQMAIKAGYKSADVDAFITQQKNNAATMQLGQQGQLPAATYDKILETSPQLGEKLFKAGVKPQTKSTASQQKNSDAYNSSLNFIQTLERNYQDAGGGTFGTGPQARIQGLLKSLSGKAGLDDSASAYEREKEGFAATLKSLTGDTGVLTDQDFARLSKLLPDLGSTPGEAKKLLNDLRGQLAAKFGGKKTQTEFNPKGITKPQGQQGNNLQVLGAETGPKAAQMPQQPNEMQQLMQMMGKLPTAQDIQAGVGNFVADNILPRTKAALTQGPQAMMQKAAARPDVKGNLIQAIINSAQATGDLAKVAVPAGVEAGGVVAGPSAFAASSIPTAMAATGALGALHGATTPNATLPQRAQHAATEGGIAALTTGALRGGEKLLHPFKNVGEYRAAKIAEAQGKTIDGDTLVTSLQKIRAQVPSTELQSYDNMVASAKNAYAGKEISVEDAVALNKHFNDAFTASGKVGKTAKALVEKTMGDTLKGELKLTAPEVAKANQLFKFLYSSQKNMQRFAYPAAIAGGAGAGGAALMRSFVK